MGVIVTVATARDVDPGTVAIEFETPNDFGAEPSQFVRLPAEVDDESYARFYTLSSPGIDDMFEVTVGIDPEGAGPFSQHLGSLAAGNDVEISGPFGQSYYDGESRAIVFMGGPGVSPATGITEAVIVGGNEAAMVYLDDAPAHEERLSVLHDDGASVVVIGDKSDLADTVADALTGDEGKQLFVYGFADFVSHATDAVETTGGDADAAKVENFG